VPTAIHGAWPACGNLGRQGHGRVGRELHDAQAFGNRSKQHLSDLCFKKPAQVGPQTKDRYGRTVGRVTCDGVDANAEQVRAGTAWVFDKYVVDRGLYAVQAEARAAKRGLWADGVPVAPWEWRKDQAAARP